EGVQHLRERMPRNPAANDSVHFLDMAHAIRICPKPRVVSRTLAAGQLEYTARDARRGRRKRYPSSVFRHVGIARRVVGRAIARALLADAELVVRRGLSAEQREQRLVEREVDDLSLAASLHIALIDREHHGEGAMIGRNAIGEAEGRER